MITAEWLSAIAAIISIPISIWAIIISSKNARSIKKVEQQMNNNIGGGNVIAMRDGNTFGIGNRK